MLNSHSGESVSFLFNLGMWLEIMPTEMYTNVYMEKVFHLSPLCIFVHRKNVSCLSKCIFIMDICLKFLSYVPFLCETISYALWKNKVNLLNVKIWSMVFDKKLLLHNYSEVFEIKKEKTILFHQLTLFG